MLAVWQMMQVLRGSGRTGLTSSGLCGVRGERAVAGLARHLGVPALRPHLRHVGVALDAGRLAGEH